MIKTLSIAALVGSSFVGMAAAGESHRRVPADAAAYYDTYDRRPVAPATAPASAPRSDFGSFSAGSAAHNLGY